MSKLSYNGVYEFKQWAKNWGALHPFNPKDIPTGTLNFENEASASQSDASDQANPDEYKGTSQNVSQDTKTESVQAMQGVQGGVEQKKGVCARMGADTHTPLISSQPGVAPPAQAAQIKPDPNPEGLTVTQGASAEQRQFESSLIAASSMAMLQQVKGLWDEEFRGQVMEQWQKDGRYALLEAKVKRLNQQENE